MDHELQRGVTTNGLCISKENKDDTEKDLLEEPVPIFVLEPYSGMYTWLTRFEREKAAALPLIV